MSVKCAAVPKLSIDYTVYDFGFLFRLKNLIDLDLKHSIEIESVRKAFEELPFLSSFRFKYIRKEVTIRIEHPKRFEVSVNGNWMKVCDLNAAIQVIRRNNKKRKTEDLSE